VRRESERVHLDMRVCDMRVFYMRASDMCDFDLRVLDMHVFDVVC
jgi:hypothetical protein